MSFQLMAWAARQQTGSATRKAVLLALANRANHDTGRCDPSIERICEETEFSDRAVRSAIVDLEDSGFISRERKRREDGSLGTYSYKFPPAAYGALPAAGGAGSPPAGGAALNLEVVLEPGTTSLSPNGDSATRARETSTRDVIANVVDTLSEHQIPVSARHRGMLAKQAKDLLDSGFDPLAVIAACVIAQRRGQPQNAHFVAADLVAAKAGQRLTRREYERALDDEMEIGHARA